MINDNDMPFNCALRTVQCTPTHAILPNAIGLCTIEHKCAQMYTYMCTATSLHLLPFPLSNCPSVRWPTPLLTLAGVIVVTIYWTWVNVRWHLLFANVHVNHPSKIFGHFIPICCLSVSAFTIVNITCFERSSACDFWKLPVSSATMFQSRSKWKVHMFF